MTKPHKKRDKKCHPSEMQSADLFILKHRKAIARGKKLKAISKKFGKGVLKTGAKVGRKVGPAVLKQARLIQEQQRRDSARESAIIKRSPIKRNIAIVKKLNERIGLKRIIITIIIAR